MPAKPPTPATLAFLRSVAAAPNQMRYSPLPRPVLSAMRACVRRGWCGFARTDAWTYRVWLTDAGRAALAGGGGG